MTVNSCSQLTIQLKKNILLKPASWSRSFCCNSSELFGHNKMNGFIVLESISVILQYHCGFISQEMKGKKASNNTSDSEWNSQQNYMQLAWKNSHLRLVRN